MDCETLTAERTKAREIIDKIENMMSKAPAEGVRRYKINNRELERYSMRELLDLLAYWRRRFRTADRKLQGKTSMGPDIQVYI